MSRPFCETSPVLAGSCAGRSAFGASGDVAILFRTARSSPSVRDRAREARATYWWPVAGSVRTAGGARPARPLLCARQPDGCAGSGGGVEERILGSRTATWQNSTRATAVSPTSAVLDSDDRSLLAKAMRLLGGGTTGGAEVSRRTLIQDVMEETGALMPTRPMSTVTSA